MQVWWFTECPYPGIPHKIEGPSRRVALPNKYFNPEVGSRVYNEYFDEWAMADELGLNVMVNEHHQTPGALTASAPVSAAILARITKSARIVILGNPIANRRQPVRVAEEMAMIDNISRGRLEVGFVRSVASEMSPANSNPARTQERFWEAHDLILKAWTCHDGPFNWEGKYFHQRQVNIWPATYQRPHPPIWSTGRSAGSARDIARRGYTFGMFVSGFKRTREVFAAYRDEWEQTFGDPTPENRLAYSAPVYVAETEERAKLGAQEIIKNHDLDWLPMQFVNPPGYSALEVNVAVAKAGVEAMGAGAVGAGRLGAGSRGQATVEQAIDEGVLFAGTPDQVIEQISRHHRETGGYGNLLMIGQHGEMSYKDTVHNLELFTREVYPALRELKS